ncbi:MAG: hypothetical protein PHF44_01115 [Candidatus Pacebacteria bacterium]|nr:hypothetical protein [Candidatus Paceibacterota bacterium]
MKRKITAIIIVFLSLLLITIGFGCTSAPAASEAKGSFVTPEATKLPDPTTPASNYNIPVSFKKITDLEWLEAMLKVEFSPYVKSEVVKGKTQYFIATTVTNISKKQIAPHQPELYKTSAITEADRIREHISLRITLIKKDNEARGCLWIDLCPRCYRDPNGERTTIYPTQFTIEPGEILSDKTGMGNSDEIKECTINLYYSKHRINSSEFGDETILYSRG